MCKKQLSSCLTNTVLYQLHPQQTACCRIRSPTLTTFCCWKNDICKASSVATEVTRGIFINNLSQKKVPLVRVSLIQQHFMNAPKLYITAVASTHPPL